MPRQGWIRRPEGEAGLNRRDGIERVYLPDDGVRDRKWMEDGNCTSLDPYTADAIFYPDSGEFRDDLVHAYCDFCPVREECFEYGKKYGMGIGRWGGRAISSRTDPGVGIRRAASAERRRRRLEEDAMPVPRRGQEAVGEG